MFTGIVIATGEVRVVEALPDARRLEIAAPADLLEALRPGDSIAVDGVCQTVIRRADDAFVVEAIATTLARTTLGMLEPGRRVNLEPALAVGDRLGGHLVQGHVDGVGRVLAIQRPGEHVLLDVSLPDDVAAVTVPHGSIAIDGVSLTVNATLSPDSAQVALIPYTWEHTNLNRLAAGSAVNVEGDMIGRFVVHHLQRRESEGGRDAV